MNRHIQNPGAAAIYQNPRLYGVVAEALTALNPGKDLDFTQLLLNYYPVCLNLQFFATILSFLFANKSAAPTYQRPTVRRQLGDGRRRRPLVTVGDGR